MLKVLDSAVPVACWSCSVAHNDVTLFCPHCSKIQPPPGGDYFSVFGLEERLDLDLAALEHEFHRLSRKVHPDRFARAGDNERQWSLADTALLNDAYRTLKDPLHRTEYLLKLGGAEIGEEHSGKDRKDPSRFQPICLKKSSSSTCSSRKCAWPTRWARDPELQSSLNRETKFDGLLQEVDRGLRAVAVVG